MNRQQPFAGSFMFAEGDTLATFKLKRRLMA
jgi:hypothetical protein